MDIEGRSHLVQILKKIVSEQKTGMIISSHLIHDIEHITSKVCIVSDGKWLETKKAEEIKKSHGTIEAYYLDTIKAVKEIGK
jgi:ABC-type multidrug transport system, ATPase component